MKPKQPKFLHEFLVTQENHIPFLLGLDILTDQKCILDLNEKILLCGRDKFTIPLLTQNVNNVNSFTLLLETLIIPARHEAWIDVIVKNENAEVTKKSQGLVEGLKDFENRTGVLVADCLISVNDSKSQLRVFNLSDNDIKLFQNTKIGEFFSNDDSIQVNGLFTSKNKPKHPEAFRMGTYATLEGKDLSRNQSDQVVAVFMRHNQVFSRNSNDLGFCDKIKHKIKLEKDAKPFRRPYGSMSFEKRKAKKIVENLEEANLVEPTHSFWSAPSIAVKKKDGTFRLVVDYRGLNKQIENKLAIAKN